MEESGAHPLIEMSQINDEDALIDLCQTDTTLVNGVARLLITHLKKATGMQRPFTVLKAWFKVNLPESQCEWHTQSFDILAQWITSLVLFAKFQPEPLKYAETEEPIIIPTLIMKQLVPMVLNPVLMLGDHGEKIVEKGKHIVQEAPTNGSIMSKNKGSTFYEANQDHSSTAHSAENPTTDIMQAMFAQLNTQSSINQQILESLKELKSALPAAHSKDKPKAQVPCPPSSSAAVPQQADINVEILKSLQSLHQDKVKPTHEVIEKELVAQIMKLHDSSNMTYGTKAAVEAAQILQAMYTQGIPMGPDDEMGPIAHTLSLSIQSSLIGAAFPPSQKPQIREKQSLLHQVCGNTLAPGDYKNAYQFGNDRGR